MVMLALGVVAFGFIGGCGVFGIIVCLSRGHDETLLAASLVTAAIGLPVAIQFASGLSRAVNRKGREF